MNNYKKHGILIFILVLLFIASLVIYNMRNKKSIDEETSNKEEYKLLDDYSRFFTINSCVYKYIVYLQNNDTDSLLKVLDKDFVDVNSIDSNNIYNYIEKLSGNYSFNTKKVYYEELNNQYTKYYVYGQLLLEQIDEKPIEYDRYYIVTFDLQNYLYSIIPYDGTIFMEDSNG